MENATMIRLRRLAAAGFAALTLLVAAPASAVDDPIVAPAMARQIVGETAEGYLAFVRPATPADADVQRRINEINIKRREIYTQLAREQNQPVEVVAALTAEKQFERLDAGEMFRDGRGTWTPKPARGAGR
jgi:uncharacterized protein